MISNRVLRLPRLYGSSVFCPRPKPVLKAPRSAGSEVLLPLSSFATIAAKMAPTPWQPNSYPPTRRADHVNVYKSASKGIVKVPDPYMWLESYTDELDQWTTAQANFTRAYLDKNPHRDALEAKIRANFNYAKFSAPSLKNDGRWYWSYNSGLEAQSVLYRSKDENLVDFSQESGPGGEVFFDPNLLSEDGTTSLSVTAFSKCGKYFAYSVSVAGSDRTSIYVRSTDSPLKKIDGKRPGTDDGRLNDELRFVKFSTITWTHDSKGFFYQRFPTPEDENPDGVAESDIKLDADQNAMLFYHRIGTSQKDDILVMKDPENPSWMWHPVITELDGRYLVLGISKDTSRQNLLWVADLQENEIGPNLNWMKIVDTWGSQFDLVANDGTKLYLKTNKDAPMDKIIAVDLSDPIQQRDLIPEADAYLEDVVAVNEGTLVVVYQRNVTHQIFLYSLKDGKELERLASDFIGSANISGKRDQSSFFVSMVGFNIPNTIARYNFEDSDENQRWSIYRRTHVKGLNLDEFTTEQVWFASKDGTKIPMYIVRHESTPRDGTAPAIQYGYGGFGVSIMPKFSVDVLTFIKHYGAMYVSVNMRGGGEFGEEWHQAGTREKKINVFDDFIAATEYLRDNKIADKVAINGASNGGLLISACVHRAPEGTFSAAIAEVGVMDMLKFADFTIGRAWTADYGDPHDPKDFDFIHPYSPVHNIPKGRLYPPTLLLTADHDDRVVPLHSFKLIAALQHDLAGNADPLLIRVDKNAGHGAGKSTDQRIKQYADMWGFFAQSNGLQWRGD